jgi:fatty-acid desaturase
LSVPQSTADFRPATGRLALPAAVDRRRIVWSYAVTVGLYHLIATLAVLPWLFSWTGVVLAVLGLYVFGSLGINLCYHRLLTHRGLVCPKWLEHGFAMLAVCSMQDTPARWVAVHRRHHEHSDRQDDPHSPLVAFLWGHVGWMLVENRDLVRLGIYERYAKDILRDPFYRRMERTLLYPAVLFGSWAVFFLGGFAAGLLGGGSVGEAAQFGTSLLIWGVFVRTVVVWHITWSVNSLAHLWGYRSYDTGEQSRNNWFVALISNGEGWHNNHHADPRSAAHGHRWWEIDVVFTTVRVLEAMGLATKVCRPDARLRSRR